MDLPFERIKERKRKQRNQFEEHFCSLTPTRRKSPLINFQWAKDIFCRGSRPIAFLSTLFLRTLDDNNGRENVLYFANERKAWEEPARIEKLDSSASMEGEKNELTMSPYRRGSAARRRGGATRR